MYRKLHREQKLLTCSFAELAKFTNFRGLKIPIFRDFFPTPATRLAQYQEKSAFRRIGTAPAMLGAATAQRTRSTREQTMTDFTMSDTKRFLLAAGAAMLLSVACLSAALSPANAAPVSACGLAML
jgi:hypothetical protein